VERPVVADIVDDVSASPHLLSVACFTVSFRTGGNFPGDAGPRCDRSSQARFGWRPSMPVPMWRLVADGRWRRLKVGLRQLLPGFLQPPLVSRRIHDAGRTTPRESGFAGNEHDENDRSKCQRDLKSRRVLHIAHQAAIRDRRPCDFLAR
jgi:hypothetical protein